MNFELEQAARSYLANGEKILWSGQPRGGIRLRASDAFAIPFSLLWCGFAVFWEYTVITSGATSFMVIWGIPFVGMGLYITVGRFFVDAWLRESTQYFITDDRVLIVQGIWSRDVKSLPLRSMSSIELSERSDGSGTITLGPSPSGFGGFTVSGWPGSRRFQPPALELVENARQVHETLRTAVSASAAVPR